MTNSDIVFVVHNDRKIDTATSNIEVVVQKFNPSYLNHKVEVFKGGWLIETIENNMRITKDILRERLSAHLDVADRA